MILTEEALPPLMSDERLLGWLNNQPPWSDFPSWCWPPSAKTAGREGFQLAAPCLGNLVLLERPLNAENAGECRRISGARAPARQYAAREHLEGNWRTPARLKASTTSWNNASSRGPGALQRQRPPDEGDQRARASAGGADAGAEDGGDRPAHGRHRARLQQPADVDQHELWSWSPSTPRREKVKPVVDRAKSAARRGARLTNQLLRSRAAGRCCPSSRA